MRQNERLVPICIIYLDGVRLSPALEGAFRSANVYDRMNEVSNCVITFDYQELNKEDLKAFEFNTQVSIHMGYKDNTKEVFTGELTRNEISLSEYGSSLYSVTASSCLWRLDHGVHTRHFYNKTPSQAIQETLERYNIQCDSDSFGFKSESWGGGEQSDLQLVLGLADTYGKDICVVGNKVYVKELMTHNKEDIIYEWGKSLISFRVKENIKEQVSKVQIIIIVPRLKTARKREYWRSL